MRGKLQPNAVVPKLGSGDPQGYLREFQGGPIYMIIMNQMGLYGSVTLRVYKWNQTDPLGFGWIHLYTLSYRPIKVHLAPNYHLAGSPRELCQVPLGVPGPQFGNHWLKTLKGVPVQNGL